MDIILIATLSDGNVYVKRRLRSDEAGGIKKDNRRIILRPISVEENIVFAVLLSQNVKMRSIKESAIISKENYKREIISILR